MPSWVVAQIDELSTYNNLKRVARQTGDAAKEWLSGHTINHDSALSGGMQQTTDEAYEGTKRAAGSLTQDAKEKAQRSDGVYLARDTAAPKTLLLGKQDAPSPGAQLPSHSSIMPPPATHSCVTSSIACMLL